MIDYDGTTKSLTISEILNLATTRGRQIERHLDMIEDLEQELSKSNRRILELEHITATHISKTLKIEKKLKVDLGTSPLKIKVPLSVRLHNDLLVVVRSNK